MSTDPINENLYLIDAHSLIYQVFHALPDMTSPSGLPTNALFGFTKDILHIRNERRPAYLVCVFDVPGKIFREDIYPEYKAHRAPMPDDLKLQIPLIREMLEAMRVPVLGKEGFEADDVIATLAVEGARKGLEVFICSSDKDCRQLLSERIRIYNLRKREVYDRDALQKDWGVAPEQVVDFQTLVGDAVDNVPGVPGIGPKTATALLQQYQTLDNLLAHIEEIPGKKKENLRAALSLIPTSRQLVQLATTVPIVLEWDHWHLQPWDGPKLVELFRSWGFRGLTEQVRTSPGSTGRPKEGSGKKTATRVQGSLFGEESSSPSSGNEPVVQVEDHWQANYHLVNSPEKFESFFKELQEQKRLAVDLETTSLEPRLADIVGLAFCWQPGEAWYLALRGPAGETTLDAEKTLARLRPILENAAVDKINQNIKYDMEVLLQHGISLAGVAGDPMVADYLLHAGERSHNMEVLAEKHLHHRIIPITDLIGKGKNQLRMDQVACARVAEYSGEDADVAWRLCAQLEPELQQKKLQPLYEELEIPLIEVLAEMEFTGIRLDLEFLQRLAKDMDQMLTGLEQDVFRLAGRSFNIASVKQLREVLFQEMGFKPDRKTTITRVASTDQETLEGLARQGHELPKKLLEHRQIAKLKGTYVDALPALVNPTSHRIHGSFNQTVAATGRLSSSDPNMQNIPIRTDLGGNIRRAFLPEPGWKLVTADYSQIELRLLAHFCEEPELRQAFAENHDIHSRVAAQIFGVPESEVTREMRRRAKTINFGIIYGLSAFGLAARLQISQEEAAQFIDAYFARYPGVLTYQENLLAQCREQGYVATILGRQRYIAGIRQKTGYKNRNQPEREAINMQIQGSAADLIKAAMVNLQRRLKKEKRRSRLLLQIHDELVFEVPPEELNEVAVVIHEEMTGALASKLQVKLGLDMGVGDNWLDTVEMVL